MTALAARHIHVEGVVQGVGFRPFVHGLAGRHGLAGWVRNTGSGVEAVVEGDTSRIAAFLEELTAGGPPLARVAAIHSEPELVSGRHGFIIAVSAGGPGTQPVPADTSLCDDCRKELFDPADRRFHYPFINCTNCGPRYTIVEDLPYDRERTTMAGFAMCAACRSEYDDPNGRRFHAEPIACPDCGPQVRLIAGESAVSGERALAGTRALLARGAIVAIKSLGGYNLACGARNERAVAALRTWKARGDKPLAVMARDAAAAERIACANDRERELLASPAHPVVVLDARSDVHLAAAVHPGTNTVGVMLPYTPLHALLMAGAEDVLVMTSANRSSEPMIVDDSNALARLPDIAEAILTHDRPIAARIDDSVVQVAGDAASPLRRARGYAPLPLRLPFDVPPLLACGADIKNAFCYAAGGRAVMSSYIGDLENYDVYREYENAIERLGALLRIDPQLICYDAHPAYWSRRYAEEHFAGRRHIAVQHHHAHVAACMAENGIAGDVIGVAFDGTGFGDDRTIWGGEFLIAGYATYERAAHLANVPMYGGASAIREPWRMALAYLRAAGIDRDDRFPRVSDAGAPLTSSAGRLFDAVAALLGIGTTVTYEAQAAIALESIVASGPSRPYEFAFRGAAPRAIDVTAMIANIVTDRDRGVPAGAIAARFHATMADIVVQTCRLIRAERDIDSVVLTGGVFQNRTLTRNAVTGLANDGFRVFRHREVPANDGGIALGQAVVAAAQFQRGAGACA